MEWLIIAFVVLLVVAFLFRGKDRTAGDASYELHGPLFTPAERSFYGVLKQACGDKAEVFGKVRVADVIKPSKGQGRSSWQRAFNRIAAKHFDYVICEPGDLSVIAAIELNDRSHKKRARADRDALLEKACGIAGLALHQFDAKHGYQVGEVRGILFRESGETPTVVGEPSTEQGEVPPQQARSCPKCGAELVRRIANKGAHKGSEFLACSGFPACRYIAKPVSSERTP